MSKIRQYKNNLKKFQKYNTAKFCICFEENIEFSTTLNKNKKLSRIYFDHHLFTCSIFCIVHIQYSLHCHCMMNQLKALFILKDKISFEM